MTQQTYNVAANFPPGVVAIPCMDWIWTHTVVALFNLTRGLPTGSTLSFGLESSSAAFNRNELTERFLAKSDWRWILYCDSDMTPPVDAVVRLLSRRVDVIGALYAARRPPFASEFGNLPVEPVEPEGRGYRQVQWVGAGCLLVKREVLERMPYPWFEHPTPGEGEDVLFCSKVRQLGLSVHLDYELHVGHVGAKSIEMEDARRWQESYRSDHKGPLWEGWAGSQRHVQDEERGTATALKRMGQALSAYDANGVRVEQPAAAR